MGFAVAFPRGGSSSTVSRSNWNLEVLVFHYTSMKNSPSHRSRKKPVEDVHSHPLENNFQYSI